MIDEIIIENISLSLLWSESVHLFLNNFTKSILIHFFSKTAINSDKISAFSVIPQYIKIVNSLSVFEVSL